VGGGLSPRQHPTRTCVACRTARPKRELLRVVRTPGGTIALDATGRAPGRGAYVCVDPACHDLAMAKGTLRRALAAPIPPGLFDPMRAGAPTPLMQNHVDQEGGA